MQDYSVSCLILCSKRKKYFPLQKVIAKLISEKQMEKYSDLAVQNFVDSSTGIRWCPYPDCGYAICIRRDKEEEEEERVVKDEADGATAMVSSKKMTPGENVECGQGHGFCW